MTIFTPRSVLPPHPEVPARIPALAFLRSGDAGKPRRVRPREHPLGIIGRERFHFWGLLVGRASGARPSFHSPSGCRSTASTSASAAPRSAPDAPPTHRGAGHRPAGRDTKILRTKMPAEFKEYYSPSESRAMRRTRTSRSVPQPGPRYIRMSPRTRRRPRRNSRRSTRPTRSSAIRPNASDTTSLERAGGRRAGEPRLDRRRVERARRMAGRRRNSTSPGRDSAISSNSFSAAGSRYGFESEGRDFGAGSGVEDARARMSRGKSSSRFKK